MSVYVGLIKEMNQCKRGSYMCVCNDGYLGNGDIGCTDKDECQLNEDNCAANAESGVYNDIYDSYFIVNRLKLTKTLLKCHNTPGSFTCECSVGFTHELSDPTKLCLDLGSYFQIT